MNYLKEMQRLNNAYYIMRHGESKANAQHLIVSSPEIGIIKYGLTEKGKKQVLESIKNFKELDNKTIIISSDFLRAKETAEIVQKYLKANPITINFKLRERYFGDLDMKDENNYEICWKLEREMPKTKKYNIETLYEIESKITLLIKELEIEYKNKNILLISHGDPLRSLKAAFKKLKPYEYKKLKLEKNAEIIKLKFN